MLMPRGNKQLLSRADSLAFRKIVEFAQLLQADSVFFADLAEGVSLLNRVGEFGSRNRRFRGFRLRFGSGRVAAFFQGLHPLAEFPDALGEVCL